MSSVLQEFMQEEIRRMGDPEEYIKRCYEGVSPEQLTHPAFALMEYPTFDGMAGLEQDGSIVDTFFRSPKSTCQIVCQQRQCNLKRHLTHRGNYIQNEITNHVQRYR